jgi:hypothetical protein
MSLIDNLNAINTCKEEIKSALEGKGVNMNGVAFSGYADKINALQLESGDTPTPSADYIYSNGYPTDVTETNDIVTYVPYKIILDGDGKFIIELTNPEEIPGYDGGSYYDIVFGVDVPNTYQITNFELYAELLSEYVPQDYKENPRHSTVVRDGVVYNSYVRAVSDGIDIGSADVQYDPLKYRITIKKI